MEIFFQLVENYGLYVIFFIVALEYACFPIPSEVVLPIAGAIGYINNVHPLTMIFFSIVAGLFGSLFCYFLGYFGKNKIINKMTKKKDKEISESRSLYQKYSNVAILFGRLIPICRTYISFIAGANKHKLPKYILFTTIGITIWNSVLIYLGYYFYNNLEVIGPMYAQYKNIILAVAGLIIIFIIIHKIVRKIKNKRAYALSLEETR